MSLIEERILRLEQYIDKLFRSRTGIQVIPGKNILGQDTEIRGDLYIDGEYDWYKKIHIFTPYHAEAAGQWYYIGTFASGITSKSLRVDLVATGAQRPSPGYYGSSVHLQGNGWDATPEFNFKHKIYGNEGVAANTGYFAIYLDGTDRKLYWFSPRYSTTLIEGFATIEAPQMTYVSIGTTPPAGTLEYATNTTPNMKISVGNVESNGVILATTYVPLAVKLSSTSWNGDSFSTTAKTLIDLSAVFGAPAGIKAINVRTMCRDSGSAAGSDICLILSNNNTTLSGEYWNRLDGVPDDKWHEYLGIVNCDANGDVYVEIKASNTGTFDVWWEIYGYWI